MRASIIDAERVNWLPFTAFFILERQQSASGSDDGKAKDKLRWEKST